MRRRGWLAGLAAALWLPLAGAYADGGASLRVLQACLAQPVGARAESSGLAAPCPQLPTAINHLGVAEELSSDWTQHLSRSRLLGLIRLVQRYQGSAPSSAPRVSELPRLTHAVTPYLRHPSWWQRLKSWIGRLLLRPATASIDSSWLQQLLSRLLVPRPVQRLLLYLITAAVLAMATALVLRELLVSGVLARARRPGRRRSPPVTKEPEARPGLSLEQIARAPSAEQSILLVRVLVQVLRQSGRLADDASLTYRELAECRLFDTPQLQVRFERLTRRAERDRYGALTVRGDPEPPPDADRELSDGYDLYRQLAMAPRRCAS